MSSNFIIFDQKMDIYGGLSELSRPRIALRGLKLKLGQFYELKDGIGVAKSWKNLKNGKKFKSFYQETSIWSRG